ncbi:BatD family protein [Pseudomonas schmalbachii]|uniref:BatD family protein n=1 Tax=Pseudomonas schmalbachii TaxID=2816993 RepID=A0ABS3TWA7_9PSED|nr:BatD family protein [Pseudomonas schmalbachii]MBO3277952.1 BatD family protein [Pseudomonas schmalbachii]
MRRLLLILCCLCPLLAFAEPKVLVESRLQPGGEVVVGRTLDLEVDVLVDTWFTAAPQLPTLELPGALVTPPAGSSQHLTLQRDGATLFGLRYIYRITPTRPQGFAIPALQVTVTAGEASAPVSVRSQPLRFSASLPAGGENLLVAEGLRLSQTLGQSSKSLQVGDSITRRITLQADGAQAMLLEALPLAEVDGLRRYPKSPQVSDIPSPGGRGGVAGGQRIDSASYVIEKPGRYRLPAIELRWWDIHSGQARTASLPALEFEASASTRASGPFSIDEELRQLGHDARISISRHGTALLAALFAGTALFYWGQLYWRSLWRAARRFWRARREAWRRSAGHAWRRIPAQLRASPARLDALYLWARRAFPGSDPRLLGPHLPNGLRARLQDLLRACYGRDGKVRDALAALRRELPVLRRQARRQVRRNGKGALAALNPTAEKRS